VPWFHVKVKLFWRILVFCFNMEPRLKWNKIIFRILQCSAVRPVLSCGGQRFVRQWSAVCSLVVCGGLRFSDLPSFKGHFPRDNPFGLLPPLAPFQDLCRCAAQVFVGSICPSCHPKALKDIHSTDLSYRKSSTGLNLPFVYHWTPVERGVAPFMLALRCQYLNYTLTVYYHHA